jgi:hypothetical protein
VWDEAAPIIAEVAAIIGKASTVKVTVIGRPNQVVERQGVVVVALRSTKAPPTASYTIEDLEAEVILARRAAHQPAVDGHAAFDSMPFDAPPEGGDHRSRKTWRNFYAALFFGDRPTPAPYGNTPREHES